MTSSPPTSAPAPTALDLTRAAANKAARGDEAHVVSRGWLWRAILCCLLVRPRRIVTRQPGRILGKAGFFRRQARVCRCFCEQEWRVAERFELIW
ncbi:MAG: hypothetical protein FJ301_12635 [Planctomycetes bacterium]|nr:hypothetical protein [Planctomycetota bacterium]